MQPTIPIEQPPKRHILRNIFIGVFLLAIVGVITYFVIGAIHHSSIVGEVKTEVIKQNKIMRATVDRGMYSPDIPKGVASTDKVHIELAVSMSGLSYCLSGKSVEDEGIVFHMDAKTKEDTPLAGGCSESASSAPTVPAGVALTSTGTDAITLEWKAAPYTEKYVVECALSETFVSGLKTVSTSQVEVTLSGLEGNTSYYCRVAAKNSKGQSVWSPVVTASTQLASPVITTLKITTVSSKELAYSWQPVSGALSYVLEYSTDNSFLKDITKIETTETTGIIKGLKSYTGYFFHLKVITAAFPEDRAAFSPIVQGRTSR